MDVSIASSRYNIRLSFVAGPLPVERSSRHVPKALISFCLSKLMMFRLVLRPLSFYSDNAQVFLTSWLQYCVDYARGRNLFKYRVTVSDRVVFLAWPYNTALRGINISQKRRTTIFRIKNTAVFLEFLFGIFNCQIFSEIGI